MLCKSNYLDPKIYIRILHDVIPAIRCTGSYTLNQTQSVPKGIIAAPAVKEINELVSDISPRLAQYLIDHAISEVLELPFLPGTVDTFRGVVKIAEDMRLPVNPNNRSQLGRFVRNSEVGSLGVSEKRLVNGTMRDTQCYSDNEAVRNVIRSFFQ